MSEKVKVSDWICQFLEEQGVSHVFLLSGGMMMHLLDSLSRSRSIKYVCNHHEQACAMAAEAFARESGRLGVCYATSGPGATNTITGILGAWLDSSPVLFLTGQSRTALTVRGVGLPDLRMVGNFEVDIVEVAKPITKYAAFVDDPKSIACHLSQAIHLARSGRPGPVLLDIPLDVQGASVDRNSLAVFVPPPRRDEIPIDAVTGILQRLRNAERPLILAGHGVRVAGAAEAFRRLVPQLGVPVATTQLANDLLPYSDPYYVGKVGLRGDRAGNFAVQNCDVLLVVGSSLHITTTGYELQHFAPKAEKIIVNLDEAELARDHVRASTRLRCDLGAFLSGMAEALQRSSAHSGTPLWLERCRGWKERYPVAREPHKSEGDTINTYQLVDLLSDLLKGDETLVTDAGSLYYIVGQAFRTKARQRVIVSGALGSMGYALPAALGAAYASPDKMVICLTGDGSMHANVQELATLVNSQLNCKIIMINNGGYASIRNTQATFCEGNIAGASRESGVTFPDWRKLAEAYGVQYIAEQRMSTLAKTLAYLLDSAGPVFCEIIVPETVEMFPAVTSEKLPDGSFKSNRLHEMSPALPPEMSRDSCVT